MGVTTADALEQIDAVLDGIDHAARLLTGDVERLGLIGRALRVRDRLDALMLTLVAEAEAADAAHQAHGTSTTSWLAETQLVARREASRTLHRAREQAACPRVARAAQEGRVTGAQAAAIAAVLARLPEELSSVEVEQAEVTILGYADRFDAHGLRHLGEHLVEVVAPEVAERVEGERVEREYRQAQRDRYLSFTEIGGQTLIRGALPSVDAAPLVAAIDAYAAHTRRTVLELRDPDTETVRSPGQARADALLALLEQIQHAQLAPALGGDRPRLMITIDHDQLMADVGAARTVTTGMKLTPAQLRQVACDCDILPVVLDGDGVPLDVGRERRLVTPAQRAALALRDQGCIFPGCDKPPGLTEAHHIIPWWRGGRTDLNNLVLLCRHHHALIEPDRGGSREQWQVRLAHGIAEIIPPRYVDPDHTPRVHQRFALLQILGDTDDRVAS